MYFREKNFYLLCFILGLSSPSAYSASAPNFLGRVPASAEEAKQVAAQATNQTPGQTANQIATQTAAQQEQLAKAAETKEAKKEKEKPASEGPESKKAAIVKAPPLPPCTSFVLTLSGGPAWESVGNTQTFLFTPSIQNTYAAVQTTRALADGEIFLGIQKQFNKKIQYQLGLAAATTMNAKLSGNILDDNNLQANNYTYDYQIRHTHLAIKGKLLVDICSAVMPWISASMGLGFNQAYQFTATPLVSPVAATPFFLGRTTRAFTYTIGFGIQQDLTKNTKVGIGYEFADWGKTVLAPAPNQTTGDGLSLNHVYTNGFMLSLSYVC